MSIQDEQRQRPFNVGFRNIEIEMAKILSVNNHESNSALMRRLLTEEFIKTFGQDGLEKLQVKRTALPARHHGAKSKVMIEAEEQAQLIKDQQAADI